MAASRTVDPGGWQRTFDGLLGQIAGRFLLGWSPGGTPGRWCWASWPSCHARTAGRSPSTSAKATPAGLQHLLSRAVWDQDAVRDDVRGYVVEHLGDPDAVLVLDETGDCKKGDATVGVQRQYTGTAGKIDNAQVAVYLTYASRHGHAIIDRELYLPEGWIADSDRRQRAGVPELVDFATKPELARVMVERALAAEVPVGWVTADEVYGGNPTLRGRLQTRGLPFVLAIKRTERLTPPGGPPIPAQELAQQVPPERWLTISAGAGAKGRRWYAWTRVGLASTGTPAGWGCWLLVRRHLRTGELAFYTCAGPAAASLAALVKVAGTRWRVEESIQAAAGAVRPG